MSPSLRMNDWFLRRRPTCETRLRLFCFPYAGGGASMFSLWSSSLPPWIELCPVQLPGRENRLAEKAFDRLPLLIQSLIPVIQANWELPLAFFGHSMGSLIVFELARAMRRQSLPGPAWVFISGRPAPQIPPSTAPPHELPTPVLMEELHQRYNGLPEEVRAEPELVEMILPILRADLALTETYEYRPEPPSLTDPWQSDLPLIPLEILLPVSQAFLFILF